MSFETLTCEDFAPHVGSDFTLPGTDELPPVHFTLSAADPSRVKAPSEFRAPFTLTFHVATPGVYPQGVYRLQHDAMGQLDIFLVPLRADDTGSDYCATVN